MTPLSMHKYTNSVCSKKVIGNIGLKYDPLLLKLQKEAQKSHLQHLQW